MINSPEKTKEELLTMILFQDDNIVRLFNKMRAKGKSFRTINSRELALFTDSLRDMKRLLFLYKKRDLDIDQTTTKNIAL